MKSSTMNLEKNSDDYVLAQQAELDTYLQKAKKLLEQIPRLMED